MDKRVNFSELALIIFGKDIYPGQVPRTDEHGKQLQALLGYLLDGGVDSRDIYGALGISSSTYYRRIREPDYPNAEELRQVATRFGLSSADLQVRFGLLSPEDVAIYTDSRHPGHPAHSATAPRHIRWR